MKEFIKKQLNLTKILSVVLIAVLAIGIIIGGVTFYNNSRRELIPDDAFDFAAMSAYQDYIGKMTSLMLDAEKVGAVKNEESPFFILTIKNTESKNYREWVSKMDNYERDISSFLNNYRSSGRQESNALYNESIEWGKAGLKALEKMKVVFNADTTDKDKLRLSQEIKSICENEIRPLDTKIGNRITDVYNKYMRELNYGY